MGESTAEVAAIAAKLTKAQREQMLDEVVRWEGGFDLRWIGHAGVRCVLQKKGLVETPMYSQRLTPLGLAVRNHLISQGAVHDR